MENRFKYKNRALSLTKTTKWRVHADLNPIRLVLVTTSNEEHAFNLMAVAASRGYLNKGALFVRSNIVVVVVLVVVVVVVVEW